MANFKIISGGKTSIDRATRDAALENDIECGNYCAPDRRAQDSRRSAHYPDTEQLDAGYQERILLNIIHSDATVIIYFDTLSGVSELTLQFCLNQQKPNLLINATELIPEHAAQKMHEFVKNHAIDTLNIEGSRVCGQELVYPYTLEVMKIFLSSPFNYFGDTDCINRLLLS